MHFLRYIPLLCLLVSCATVEPRITAPELERHIHYLASDEMAGRRTGEKGSEDAALYIRNQFKKAGCSLVEGNGFQYFDVTTNIEMGVDNYLAFNGNSYQFDKHFVPYSFSVKGELTASVVFAGYGLTVLNDSIRWDDYQGLDIDGKWVLLLRGLPDVKKSVSYLGPFARERDKVIHARDLGAAGVLFVSPSRLAGRDELVSLSYDKNESNAGIPVIHIKREVANDLLAHDNTSIEVLEDNILDKRSPWGMNLSTEVSGSADVHLVKVRAQNVIGMIKGCDPLLQNEYVVIGAHYDHLGMGGPGSGSRMPDTLKVHNGADDNASGVAALLELAQYLNSHRKEMKRSVILVAFSAEEMGLLGSRHFATHPPVPKSQIKAMINMDMVGRLKEKEGVLLIGGTGTAVENESILNTIGTDREFSVRYSSEGYGASDHAAFYAEDIPVFFFTTSAHEDYHTPFDDIDKINYQGEVAVIDMVADLSMHLVNMEQALTFQEAGPRQRVGMGKRFKVTLGIMPDFAGVEKRGLRVDMVRKDGPAYFGGLLKDDIITAIDGRTVKDIYDYMYRLKSLEEGQTITVDVIREGDNMVLLIQL